jgi:hypothetical protein
MILTGQVLNVNTFNDCTKIDGRVVWSSHGSDSDLLWNDGHFEDDSKLLF